MSPHSSLIHPSHIIQAVPSAVQSVSKCKIGHLDVDQSNLNSNGFSLIFSHRHFSAFAQGEDPSCKSNINTHSLSGILHSFCNSSSICICSICGIVGAL